MGARSRQRGTRFLENSGCGPRNLPEDTRQTLALEQDTKEIGSLEQRGVVAEIRSIEVFSILLVER